MISKRAKAVLSMGVVLLLAGLSGCPLGEPVPLDPRRLTDDPGDEMAPAFSPDGEYVAYTWVAGGKTSHVCIVSLETKEKRRLTSVPAWNGAPAWSHNGKWIAFQSNRDGDSNVYVVSAESGEGDNAPSARALTRNAGMNGAPSWSPDDRFIAFESDRNGRFDIWVMNADGDNQIALTRSASHDNRPEWSPDGRFIAFSSTRTGNRDIWVMNRDGSLPRRVTADAAAERRPKWTPDSAQLVYMRDGIAGRTEFYYVAGSGEDVQQLLQSTETIRDPVVSPSGKWLAFSGNKEGNFDIYLLLLDSRK